MNSEDQRNTKEYWFNVAQEGIQRIVQMQEQVRRLEIELEYYKKLASYYYAQKNNPSDL